MSLFVGRPGRGHFTHLLLSLSVEIFSPLILTAATSLLFLTLMGILISGKRDYLSV